MSTSAKLSIPQWILTGLVLIVGLAGAWLITGDGFPTGCPDESSRQLLTNYIFTNNRLPLGREPEIIIGTYGFSYALRPYLTAIISALFMKIISIFSTGEHAMLFASRLCSVISLTVCFLFCSRLGNRIFRKNATSIVFALAVCFIPQVMFLGMYQNNDIFSLMAVVMLLYYCVVGRDTHWGMRNCVGFAVSFSLGLMSYYSVYGWLLFCGIFLLYFLFSDTTLQTRDKLLKLLLIAGVVLLLAGWFFIRQAIINNGDMLGMATENAWRQELQEQGVEVFHYNNPSEWENASFAYFLRYNDFEWIRWTIRSFIGSFGFNNIYLHPAMYYFYLACFGVGIALYVVVMVKAERKREHLVLFAILLLSSVVTLALSLYQSYTRDYQAQGRYVITIAILIAYMMAYSNDWLSLNVARHAEGDEVSVLRVDLAFCALWIAAFFVVFFTSLSEMFVV